MKDLRGFADQGTPLMEDIGAAAPDLSKATQNLPAFLRAGVPALTSLGDAAEAAGPKLVAADPVVVQTRDLTNKAGPTATDLAGLLGTFNDTGGFQHLMDFIYNSVGTINGFDQFGHFQRAIGLRSNCLDILTVVSLECEAFFFHDDELVEQEEEEEEEERRGCHARGSGLAPSRPGQRSCRRSRRSSPSSIRPRRSRPRPRPPSPPIRPIRPRSPTRPVTRTAGGRRLRPLRRQGARTATRSRCRKPRCCCSSCSEAPS